MPNNELSEFMKSATSEIQVEYNRIQKRATEDPGTAGDQGEENWATLLRDWLPPIFQIVTKGRILNEEGIASPQVDIIVLKPEYPKKLLDKKLYLAGGVFAAFECKVTLKAIHIAEFIDNSIKIKEQIPKIKGTPYKELNSSIIYGLLSHSHCWKGANSSPIKNIWDKLNSEDLLKITHPIQMPDIICVADLATWYSLKSTFVRQGQDPIWCRILEQQKCKGIPITGYVCHFKEYEKQNYSFTPIGTLITTLLRRLAWVYPGIRSLASFFNDANIQGNGFGSSRFWDRDIYSEYVGLMLEQGKCQADNNWDEWSDYFF